MKRALHFLIAFFALPAAAASARAIDCANISGQLDEIICADAEMRDYQGRIAAAYGNAMGIWGGAIAPYVQRDQQEWLLAFRTMETIEAGIDEDCTLIDPDCIRAEMRRRVDALESGAYVHSGVYRAANGMKLLIQPADGGGYRVRVYDPAQLARVNSLTLAAAQSARWEGTQAMVSVMGNADGRALPADDGCTLRLTPEPLAIAVSQTGSCQGHRLDGSYSRLVGETLRGYELQLR